MMDLDLAIIPLKDSSFNSNKSCIKFYEFSSLKITICLTDEHNNNQLNTENIEAKKAEKNYKRRETKKI